MLNCSELVSEMNCTLSFTLLLGLSKGKAYHVRPEPDDDINIDLIAMIRLRMSAL